MKLLAALMGRRAGKNALRAQPMTLDQVKARFNAMLASGRLPDTTVAALSSPATRAALDLYLEHFTALARAIDAFTYEAADAKELARAAWMYAAARDGIDTAAKDALTDLLMLQAQRAKRS